MTSTLVAEDLQSMNYGEEFFIMDFVVLFRREEPRRAFEW
jgi:hypothetical protein